MFPDPNAIPDPLARAQELQRQAEVKRKAAGEMLSISEPLWMLLVSPRDRIGDPNVWSSRKSRRQWEEGGHWLQRVRQVRIWIEQEAARLQAEAAAQQAEADVLLRSIPAPS